MSTAQLQEIEANIARNKEIIAKGASLERLLPLEILKNYFLFFGNKSMMRVTNVSGMLKVDFNL